MYNINEASLADIRPPGESGEQQNKAFLMALRHAIEHDELSIDYQPRLETSTGRTNILEALVRWHLQDGTVYPDVFIDTAIRHGLIYSLDLWVFKQCCADLILLRKEVHENIKIAVNISAIECENLNHTQKLIETCHSHGLLLSDFEFEITESTHINDARKVKAFCDTFVAHGAAISLDDFGTGQSPLSSLCNFPVSTIKIDKSFVQNLDADSRDGIMIRHLVSLAHELQINIVAEGIEDETQFKTLTQLGCDQLQGYHICRPVSRYSILSYLATMQDKLCLYHYSPASFLYH